jgi:hypothetical protein
MRARSLMRAPQPGHPPIVMILLERCHRGRTCRFLCRFIRPIIGQRNAAEVARKRKAEYAIALRRTQSLAVPSSRFRQCESGIRPAPCHRTTTRPKGGKAGGREVIRLMQRAAGAALGMLACWSNLAQAADPTYIQGMDDWMIPPCQRPITPAYPRRPPECQGGKFVPLPPAATPPAGAPAAASNTTPARPPAPPAAPPLMATQDGAQPKRLRLLRARTSIAAGARLGDVRTGYACDGSFTLAMSTRAETLVLGTVARPVREEFTRAGYADPVGEKPMESDTDPDHGDLILAPVVEELYASYCQGTGNERNNGWVRVKIRWQLQDPAERKVIFSTQTEGSYQTVGNENIRDNEMFERAYRAAVRAVLAERAFHDATVMQTGYAASPSSSPAMAAGEGGSISGETVTLKRVKAFPGPLTANITEVRAAVVTVSRQGGASGSGFFVGENGYVLTSNSLVAGSRFVRVKLVTGRELVGEVVRQDKARDVALIKTEGRNFIALPLASGEGGVGTEVTAIGSPAGEAQSGSVTRGILNAYRVVGGQRFIQSDVTLLAGNGGGPLLDANGRVLGITAQAHPAATSRANYFIPIQDAIDKLALRITD